MNDLTPAPYTDAQIAALCDDLRIGRDNAPVIRKGLHVAAHHWHQNTNSPSERTTPKKLDAGLAALAVAFDEARSALGSLTDAQWEMMRHGSAMFNSDPYISRIGQRADADDPLVRGKSVELVGRGKETVLTLPDISEALDVLANAASLGAVPLDPSKRGPRPNFPLEAWTHAMLVLCNSTLRVPFTCDEKRGEPISAAACFCVNAFAVLSPTTQPTLILSAMKRAIAEQAKTSKELSAKRD